MYNSIFLFDSSVATGNLGDFIIMDAVQKQLNNIFPNSYFINTTTHDTIGKEAKMLQEEADYSFIGGTNLLTDRFKGRNRAQWKYGLRDMSVQGSIGVGVGWQSYARYNRIIDIPLKYAQKLIYSKALSHSYLHSVRDSYTQKRLSELGIDSINTACVTMWDLTPELLGSIPTKKADTVVTTITNYCNTPEYMQAYKELMEILLANYSHVKLWIQAKDDVILFHNLDLKNANKVEFISPNLPAYDLTLNDEVDYIGTRLHAGIRALQHGKRTLIVELDNRAHEIGKDTNLLTVDFHDINQISNFINTDQVMDIHVPFDNINKWKAQFTDNKKF
ncbi:hypothetical protein [Lactobacillus brevis] [Lactiplantibacillus mudanjiangensis]|uniref:polysaccharide pyruvyl transferase family protein n=1 Tax=Lactiplantibacillus mudanjiangensis TaxID=1296538 RepID=UPI00101587B8|nr:hypothetical protein [Lactobacillus brevis] [Lactiplantibacillus mudanjiangensis]